MYQFLSTMTVADPLFADLMTMSSRLLSVVIACRSSSVKLSRIIRGVMLISMSITTASSKVSRAGSHGLSVRRRSPSSFGTKWIRLRLCGKVVEVFEESHVTAEVIEVGADFGPLYETWGETKR